MVAHLTTDQKVLGSSPSADVFLFLIGGIFHFFVILNLKLEILINQNENFLFINFYNVSFTNRFKNSKKRWNKESLTANTNFRPHQGPWEVLSKNIVKQ